MNISNPQLRWQLTFEGAWPTSVAFLGSSRRLAAANEAGEIFVWDLPETPPAVESEKKQGRDVREAPDCSPVRRLDGHTNGVSRLVATADGAELISASLDHSLRIWRPDDLATGTVEVVLDMDSRKAESKRTRKEDVLTAPGVTVETLAAAHVLEGHQDWVQALNMSRDGRRLISGDASSRVIVWDLQERREITRWSGLPWNWIAAAALSPDGETALVSEYRYKRDDFDIPAPAVRFFNTSTGEEKLDVLKTLFPKYKPEETSYGAAQVWRKFVAQGLLAADFSPDGALVAVGQGGETDTGKVHLIEVATGKQLREVSGHQYGVTDVRFSADGQYLLSTGRDTMLRICQTSDGKEVAALGKSRGGQFKDWLSALAISPDETALAATDIAGLVHVWELA
jgi:WD40 repeat protein